MIGGLGTPALVALTVGALLTLAALKRLRARIPVSMRTGPLPTFGWTFVLGFVVGLLGLGPGELLNGLLGALGATLGVGAW